MRFRYANLASAAGVAAETGISAADKAVLDYATSSAKLDHIFAAKHNFDPVPFGNPAMGVEVRFCVP
jgi:hypothetical protein